MNGGANLVVRFREVWSIATGKVGGDIGNASKMLEANLVSTDRGQEGGNS